MEIQKAEELGSDVFDLIYGDADNRDKASNLIRARDKAIIERAREDIARKGRIVGGLPYVELGWIDEQLDSILRDLD
jgi:hypothetical protein